MTELVQAYGGELIDLVVRDAEREELVAETSRFPSIQVTERIVCDLELLAVGGFSPLDGFMGETDHRSVVSEMRLANGVVFPIPVTLPVDHFDGLALDRSIVLRNAKNDLLAVIDVNEIYEWDREEYCRHVLGTTDARHPLVTETEHWGKFNIAGRLRVLSLPNRPDFRELRLTPVETRAALAKLGYENVVAFQTRNPIHRAHEEMTKLAAKQINGSIFLHPTVGMTKPGDIDYFTRVRTYRTIFKNHYDTSRTVLALLPLAMRMAGPREAVWHAIIRRNYGASHFIVGRDHASPGKDLNGNPFYEPDAAQKLARELSDEIGVEVVKFGEMTYLPDEDRYEEVRKVPAGAKTVSISGTQIREQFLGRKKLPDWFTRPEIAEILSESHPSPDKQGFCIWFTGLSGAGKSATAEVLALRLNELGRRVTVLDGDVVRTHLSKGLGFSKDDRDINILRIGFVASEIVRHGGVAICAAVSPYRSARNEVRQMVGENFVEVFVDTPLDVCEERDTKGMYAKARRGEIKDFTGIDDPYEAPESAEITIETIDESIDDNVRSIVAYLTERGFVS